MSLPVRRIAILAVALGTLLSACRPGNAPKEPTEPNEPTDPTVGAASSSDSDAGGLFAGSRARHAVLALR
jgi:hypothetical protein